MNINPELRIGKMLQKKIWRTLWWLSIASIAFFRMYVVSEDEIVPTNSDSFNYATQANFYLTYSPFSTLPKQSPGLSIFAYASTQLGIPYKVSLDLLLLVVALTTSLLVSKLTSSRICGLFLFGLIALNPWFIARSKLLMSEPLFSLLLICLIACSYQFLFYPVRKWRLRGAIVAGMVSAAFILTRSEFPLLLLFWFLVGVAALAINWKAIRSKPARDGRLRLLLLLVPLITTVSVSQMIKTLHLRKYGVSAFTETEAPGFKKLISALYSIPPDEEIRFAPVTMQSLALACDASPVMNRHRKRLLSTDSNTFKSSRQFLGFDDEIGTWLNWHLIGSFHGINWHSNEAMKNAAAEIRLAQREGRLAKRFGMFPIDPLWRQWVPDIPKTWLGAVKNSIQPGLYDLTNDDKVNDQAHDFVEIGLFDSGLLRRKGIEGNTVVKVYALSEKTGFRRAMIKSSDGQIISDSRIHEFENRFEFGFILPDSVIEVDGKPKTIEFYRHQDENVPPVEIPIAANVYCKWIKIDVPNHEVEYWRISATTTFGKPADKVAIKSLIGSSYYRVFWTLMACTFLIGAIRGVQRRRLRKLFWFAAIGVSFLLARCLFYTLVEVWLYWGSFRYVEPNNLFAILVFICLAFAAGAWCNKRIGFLRQNRFSRIRRVLDHSANAA